jgi:hypothetical protein
MIAMPNDRPSKPKRYMRAPLILLSLLILSLTACSTNRQGLRSSLDFIRPAQQLPIGTFVGPTTGAVIKLRLELDGNYIVEDIGPPEFWMMAEGNKFYPQRIKFPSERGRWADRSTHPHSRHRRIGSLGHKTPPLRQGYPGPAGLGQQRFPGACRRVTIYPVRASARTTARYRLSP